MKQVGLEQNFWNKNWKDLKINILVNYLLHHFITGTEMMKHFTPTEEHPRQVTLTLYWAGDSEVPACHPSASSPASGGDSIPHLNVGMLDGPGPQNVKMTQEALGMPHYHLRTPCCSPWHTLSKQGKFTWKTHTHKKKKIKFSVKLLYLGCEKRSNGG